MPTPPRLPRKPVLPSPEDTPVPHTRPSAFDAPAVSQADLQRVEVNFARIVAEHNREVRELERKLKQAEAAANARVTMAPPSSGVRSGRQIVQTILVLLGTSAAGAGGIKIADSAQEAASPPPVDQRVLDLLAVERARTTELEKARRAAIEEGNARREAAEKQKQRIQDLEDEHDDLRRILERRGILPRPRP